MSGTIPDLAEGVAAADERIAVLRWRMAKALRGFASGLPDGVSYHDLVPHQPDRTRFPVPELVLFGLRTIMGFASSGVGERVRWSIYATVEAEPFVFELQKFGFRIMTRRGVSPKLLDRVSDQLSASLKLLEPLLKRYAFQYRSQLKAQPPVPWHSQYLRPLE